MVLCDQPRNNPLTLAISRNTCMNEKFPNCANLQHLKVTTMEMIDCLRNPHSIPTASITRSIRFSPVESRMYIPSRSSMSQCELSETWFSPYELAAMKDRARKESQKILHYQTPQYESDLIQRRQKKCSNDADIVPPSIAPNQPQLLFRFSEDTSCVRGLELRVSFQRQQNKILARRAVLKIQGWLRNHATALETATRISMVSSNCTRWAREVALEAGYTDFLEAYPMFKTTMPPPRSLMSISRTAPFPLKRKRKNACTSTPLALICHPLLESQWQKTA